jgi:H+/Cl- antiporter ClcA
VDEQRAAYLKTLVYAALLGIPAALAAALFQTALHDAIHLVWEEIPDQLDWTEVPGWYVVLVPGLAGLLVAAAVRLPGHGGHSPLEGIGLGTIALRDLPGILVAALVTLAAGLVLGPEAPLIAIGLVIGSEAARLVRVGETGTKLLVLAGAFASIAALFGGPLPAAFMLFELAALSGMLPAHAIVQALLPGFVAAGTGALVFTGIEDWPGLHTTQLALPQLPAYESVRIADLALCLPLAALVAVVVLFAHRLGHLVARVSKPRPDVALVGAGLLVGLLAVTFRGLADRPVDYVLFSGQDQLPLIVTETSASVLALVVLIKGLAYALSLGAGFRGGPVFPALVVGAALGAAAADWLPGMETAPAVAAGLAAGTAAVLRAPFTAVLLATLLLGSSAPEVAPIAILAAAVAWLVALAIPIPERPALAESDADTPPQAEPAPAD